MTDTNNKPVRHVSHGRIQAAIWRNESDKGVFYNVTFQRRYRDSSDTWQTASSFGRDDLLLLAKITDEAHSAILELQQQDKGKDTSSREKDSPRSAAEGAPRSR